MPQKRKDLKIAGANLWYLVGLITSDGCLSSDGRHIDITSKERDFLEVIKARLGLESQVCIKNKNTPKQAYRIQIANKNFYEFLLSVGLTPNKSLTLEQVQIPKIYFYDFLRGLIDGDGGIQRWIHHTNGREQWNLRVASGSMKFLEWLKKKIEVAIGAKGKFYSEGKNRFRLKYGKMAAREIVKKCYYEGCFGLQRKIILANSCLDSYRGWRKSKTIMS